MSHSHGNGSGSTGAQGLPCYNLYINGQWRAPLAEQYRPTIDPSTGETLAMIAQADIEDTRLAIRAARDAFDDGYWSHMAPGESSQLLHTRGEYIELPTLAERATLAAALAHKLSRSEGTTA